ncbi:hypothetical protein [Roseovarius atlanticus]|uniref:hypothetical protein n=1 Tax=Roseovarius atlanticus TaxID=1641875 RepID=UPI001C968D37|nr:hypothetical protein [Roseovarius atlanticus]MBY5988193.1 hypothetical protein [Roseovarius atlanticus]MBY6123584.1 hypothetical protein [Roseovarius atlanticus]MBY6148079.1 hypothetical protein [Roseovarius atlanticus]
MADASDIQRADPSAPLTPADHALAHALSIHLLTVIEDKGWTEIVRDALQGAIQRRSGQNSYAESLDTCARAILSSQPRTAQRNRADMNARNALVIFHQWRLGLALEKQGDC